MPEIKRRIMTALHSWVYMWRLHVLVRCITPYLRTGDSILDVGCGSGLLAKMLLDNPSSPTDIKVLGLEQVKRGGEPIEVQTYDGKTIPYESGTFDVVILADVLHHEEDPDALMQECIRVSKRLLVIKDHQLKGLVSYLRVSLIDWLANAPYGVPCLYKYNTPGQWENVRKIHGLTLIKEHKSLSLYPPLINFFFGRSLQYMAILGVQNNATRTEPSYRAIL